MIVSPAYAGDVVFVTIIGLVSGFYGNYFLVLFEVLTPNDLVLSLF